MYKFGNGQSIGMKLREDNRWVKKAMTIPCGAIEQRYAALFTNQKCHVAKPLRLGLAAYLQYFRGYKTHDDSKPPFVPSLMVYFHKRLTPEILGEINEMILEARNCLPLPGHVYFGAESQKDSVRFWDILALLDGFVLC